MMIFTTNAGFFKQHAETHLQKAWTVVDLEFGQLFTPYYDGGSHALSLGHPLAHAVHFVDDSLDLVNGLILLTALGCSSKTDEICDISTGLCLQLALVAIDAVNCPLSILSFATRTVSSISVSGYLSKPYSGNADWLLHKMADTSIHENTYRV